MKKLLTILLLVVPINFTIDIVGADRYADVSVVHSGLHRSDGMEDVHVVRSSENFVRMEGTTEAREKDFLSDLKGLAQDRFDVAARRAQDGSLAITLRKIK
jgi:hypothetical protein